MSAEDSLGRQFGPYRPTGEHEAPGDTYPWTHPSAIRSAAMRAKTPLKASKRKAFSRLKSSRTYDLGTDPTGRSMS